MENRLGIIAANERLKIALAILSVLLIAGIVLIARYRRKIKVLSQKERELQCSWKGSLSTKEEYHEEIVRLKEILNLERAQVVKYEVQKKELLAYIEQMKESEGRTDIRHKTIEIQRIFSDQKTNDIVKKVENTAKTLYPELVQILESRFPELNKLELQYCLMLALGYNLDEVMSILGRSEKAIKSLRYRIRKKMDMDDSINLRDFIIETSNINADNQSIM